MNTVYIAALAFLIAFFQAPLAVADTVQERRAEADSYYQQEDFKKAYKGYLKLAKSGDHYSQHQVSNMLASGEGKKADLTKAYSWSVLAAEGGQEQYLRSSAEILQRIGDQSRALNSAERLRKKYGKQALLDKSERKSADERFIKDSKCMGTKLGCRKY